MGLKPMAAIRPQLPASHVNDMYVCMNVCMYGSIDGCVDVYVSLYVLFSGGLSVAVPGEVMGLWEAYRLGGTLPWSDLFQPTIKLCEEGIPVSPPVHSALVSIRNRGYLDRHPNLR